MVKLPLTKLATAVGAVALSLTGAAGVASAVPDLTPAINSTCNYDQVMAALNAQDPAAAAKFNQSPFAQGYLRRFIASPPEKREKMANDVISIPEAQQYLGIMSRIAATCNNY